MNGKVKYIHLLFRGEKTDFDNSTEPSDSYVSEFNNNELSAATIPILDIHFVNLDALLERLSKSDFDGIIVTSPRVVSAIDKATKLLDCDNQKRTILKRINPNLVFVVGQKTGQEYVNKLGHNINTESAETGNAQALAGYILKYCMQRHSSSNIRLLYPKGNLANNSIEDIFSKENRIQVESLIVYETRIVEELRYATLSMIRELTQCGEKSNIIINAIFFSPSGIEGFLRAAIKDLPEQLKDEFHKVEFRYSSIGKTTAAALLSNNLPISCVASEPNPRSLVESIKSTFFTDP